MRQGSDSMYSLIFMLESIWYHHFSWSKPNSQEVVNIIVSIMCPGGLELDYNNVHSFWRIRSTSGNIIVSYFFSVKMEKLMESELSGIFRLKLVPKNIVIGFPGTQFFAYEA